MRLSKKSKKGPDDILKMLASLFGSSEEEQPKYSDGPGRNEFSEYERRMSKDIRPMERMSQSIRPIDEPEFPKKKDDFPKKPERTVYGIGEGRPADPTPVDESKHRELTREDVIDMMRKILSDSRAQ